MKLYYVETGIGCGIRKAKTARGAAKAALSEVGTHAGVRLVRLATDKDIAWVQGMGGYVPKLPQQKDTK